MTEIKTLLLIATQLPNEAYILLCITFVIVIVTWWGKQRHLLSVLEAHQELKRLKKKRCPKEQMIHLRKVDPFVFEEMIMTAIKRRGHKIRRNKRYTGDGGIDGRCRIKGRDYLIQAKRYKNHINPQHVEAFLVICRSQKQRGLFVHTGKTGRKSWSLSQTKDLEIISGTRLLNLLLNQPNENPDHVSDHKSK